VHGLGISVACSELKTHRASSLYLALLLTSAMLLSISISSVTIPRAHAGSLTITTTPTPAHGKSGEIILISTTLVEVPYAVASCSVTGGPSGLIAASGFFTPFPSSGAVNGYFKVGNTPAAAGGGAYTLTVTCTGGGKTDSGTFGFTVDPSITLSSSIGVQGQVISVTGVGFRQDAASCDLGDGAVTTSTSCSIALGAGTMTGQFTVADDTVVPVPPPVTVTVTVTGKVGGVPYAGGVASALFTKVAAPAISLSPSSVPPGYGTLDGTVAVTGVFLPASAGPCTLSSTSPTPLQFAASPPWSCTISSGGILTGSFAVADTNAPNPGYTIRVTAANTVYAEATLAVLNPPNLLAPAPPSGAAGTLVSLSSGANPFAVQDAGPCTITSNPSGLIGPNGCLIDSSGFITSALFIAADAGARQDYTITVRGIHGDSASTTTPFTLVAGVNLSPSQGPTGTTVTVTGSGWHALDNQVSYSVTAGGTLWDGSPTRTCTIAGGKIGTGCTFKVKSNALGGTYTLTFTASPGGDSATATFGVEATFALSPTNGGPGLSAGILSGSGYGSAQADCTPSIAEDIFGVFSCKIDANGILTGTFTIKPTATPGLHTVTITDATRILQVSVSATFNVLTPTITLSKSSGTGGDTITVTGSGFSSDDTTCQITKSSGTGPLIASFSCTMSGGNVQGSFVVATSGNPAEAKVIRVTGDLGDTTTAPFTVVPQMSVSPNPATVGDTLTVTGSNFGTPPTGGCVGLWTFTPADGALAVTACNIPADFTLGATLQLSLTPSSNSYKLTLTDSTGASASTTLNVVPRVVTLTPTSGPRGAAVTIIATGFRPTDATFTVSDTIASGATCLLTTPGTCTGSFQVALSAVPGTSTITVTGNLGDFGTATFKVTPGITLSPNAGDPGTNVLVQGSNFAIGDTSCTITSNPTGLISNPQCTVSGGGMSGSFKVASGTGGIYAVIVTGSSGDAGTAMFTATGPGPTFTLTPTSGNVGTLVSASGSGYAGTTCSLSASPSSLFASSLCTISGGALTGSFTVASGAPALSYLVTATTNAAETRAATFIVTIGPSLILSPTIGPVGTAVSASGSGYVGSTCTLSSSPSGLMSSPTCSISAGALAGGFTVASGASGTYTVTATTGAAETRTALFTVGMARTFSLTPTSGKVNTAVSVSGQNYQGTTCTLSSSPSGLMSSPTCSISAGTLTGGFTVASSAPLGSYSVTVTTDHAETEFGTFTVTTVPPPTFSLTPTSGLAGTAVSISGSGYTGTTCTLSSSPSGLMSSPTCSISAGTLSGGFTVASSAPTGSYTVTVQTAQAETATSTFTVGVLPTITLSPTSGAPGAGISISGSNYKGSTCTLSSFPSGLMSSPTCSISAGTLTAGFTVASGATDGSYTVTATSNLAGETASATFTVRLTPTFTLSPNSGRAGTAVSVSGLNYQGSTCTLSASPSTLFSSFSCAISAGKVTGGFTVASTAPAGSFTIMVTTNKGETNSATFSNTKPVCIIATATFGSEVSPAVQFLRNFRDELVLSTRAGSAFMDVFNAWYYSFSPSVAKVIMDNDPIRAPLRVFLYPLLGVLGVGAFAYSLFSWSPELAVVVAGLVSSSLIGLVYLTPFTYAGMRTVLKRRRIQFNSVAKLSVAILALAVGVLAAGEAVGSFLLLALGGSAIVLTCLIAVPMIAALAIVRAKPS